MLDLNEVNKRMRLAALADLSDSSGDATPRHEPLPSVRSEIILTFVICVLWALMFSAVLGYMDMVDARVGEVAPAYRSHVEETK